MNNGRDCPHGRQVGKCDTCDLIIAELELELEKVKSERDALADQNDRLTKIVRDNALIHICANAASVGADAVESIILDSYDSVHLNDFGGGDVNWWHDYIRSELSRAHDFYQSQLQQYAESIRQGKADV